MWQRGLRYYRSGHVLWVKKDEMIEHGYTALVEGSERYHVHIELNAAHTGVRSYRCDCPAASLYTGACKHVIAALKSIQEEQEEAEYSTIETGRADTSMKSRKEMALDALHRAIEKVSAKAPSDAWDTSTGDTATQERNHAQKGQSQPSIDLLRIKRIFEHIGEIDAPYKKDISYGRAPIRYELSDEPLSFEPMLFYDSSYGQKKLWLEMKVGRDHMYVIKNYKDFAGAFQTGERLEFGKKLVIDTTRDRFVEGFHQELFDLILEVARDDDDIEDYDRYYTGIGRRDTSLFSGKKLRLTPSVLGRLVDLLAKYEERIPFLALEPVAGEVVEVNIVKGAPPFSIEMKDKGDTVFLHLRPKSPLVLDKNANYLYYDSSIYQLGEEDRKRLWPIFEFFKDGEKDRGRPCQIRREELPTFFSDILPSLRRRLEVHIDREIQKEYQALPLVVSAYFDYHRDGIATRLRYAYGEESFDPLLEMESGRPWTAQGKHLIRDRQQERRVLAFFESYGFIRSDHETRLLLEEEEATYDFLHEGLPQLEEMAEIYFSTSFREKPIRPVPKVTVGVSVGRGDLLDVKLQLSDLDFGDIASLLKSYREKRRYHRLKDGTFLSLGDAQLAGLSDFLESVMPEHRKKGKKGLSPGDTGELDTLTVAPTYAPYLDALAKEDGSIRLEKDKGVRALLRDIKDPENADIELPTTLQATLRDYQKTGFAWMTLLARHHLGGILADDMGLGKTLQVITFLLAEKERRERGQEEGQEETRPHTSLIVVPTSLLYNWLAEIGRFAPSLSVALIRGTKKERETLLIEGAERADIVLSTYHLVRRDIELYERRVFRYLFLDEAQAIKNPTSQIAGAMKRLVAKSRFALTGTPMENSLTELWSIFDFILPGYLGTPTYFKGRFEVPIVKAEDKKAGQRLKQRIGDYILRRLKKDVLLELPDKVERELTNEMTKEQERVYTAHLVQAKKEYRALLKEHGAGESRIKILALLLRLRQIACDPALFLEGYHGGSGKLDQLEEIVLDALEQGHRILIFSQFTTMLHTIGRRLAGRGLEYLYLDGKTGPEERLELVSAFNTGETPLFLLSLKAGGTGLNLTGADMVIHYDPWWNPAVEEQATDRAYRIGQKNNVQVIKLLTKDTIEEKIFALQERKKDLIDQMIEPGESFLGKLSDEEIGELFA